VAKKPDTPCTVCGKLLWTGPRSRPAEERRCKGCRAPAVQPDESPPEPSTAPVVAEDLGPRAARLWRDLTAERLSPTERVLAEEACRAADRCDRLDAFLRGRSDAWLTFRDRGDDATTVDVVIDKALAEARQQQLALKGLVAELRTSRGKQEDPKPEASRRDELAKRREERRKAQGL
jgi:hypothetical protein